MKSSRIIAIIGVIISVLLVFFTMIGIFFRDTLSDLSLISQSLYEPQPNLETSKRLELGNGMSKGNTDSKGENQVATLDYKLEIVAENLFVPWSIVFTSPNRILLTERNGAVRVVEDGQLRQEPLYTFESVSTGGEKGLSGMALHPYYDSNKKIYICYTEDTQNGLENVIVSLTDMGDSLTDPQRIFDGIPSANNHAGCRIAFGPDNLLYVTTGDALERQQAQDLDSLAGKTLRITAEGDIPADNPFSNSPIFSYGHRNHQGLAWHPETGQLFSSEHGPSVFDGPRGGDEINLLRAGENYGWPAVSHQESQEGMIDPLVVYTPAIAPASAHFYSGEAFPALQNYFLMGGLVGTDIYYALFNPENPREVMDKGQFGLEVGRIRDITTGPDGFIYFVTSNQDGRGNPRNADDTLYRLVPENKM